MPLLHQNTSRGGGGPSDMSCQSLAEFLGLDTMLTEPVEASTAKNNCEEWSWETPGSPEVAQTPRALVPPGCFPPRHPRAFASFSESAQPGAMLWSEESNDDQGIQDVVSSLKALTLPSEGAGPALALCVSPPPSSLHDHLVEPPWPPEGASVQLRNEKRPNLLSRRASFCGVVTAGRNGNSALRWSGVLPAREPDPDGGYSPKLFLGGLPWDITENALMYALRLYQPLCLEWPGRDTGSCMRGFAYVTLESERRVRALLADCRRDTGDWYYRLRARKCRTKEVQVIPWAVSDANWVNVRAARLEAGRTVFVGALHGMLSAAALAIIMNDLFSGVVYAGIDTDKNKYPIGSGRVTFNNIHSYVSAIAAAYIEIHTDKFTKKVQIDPYLEDSMCSLCNLQQGPYFCREPTCFGYFCRSCWSWKHSTEDHRPLMRNSKSCLPVPPGHNGASNDHTAGHNGASNEHAVNHNGHSHHSDGTPSPPAMNGNGSGCVEAESVVEDRDPWPQN